MKLGTSVLCLKKKIVRDGLCPVAMSFSATIISMACLHASLPVGLVCLLFSALLGLVRVLGGVHYPKDVLLAMLVVSCGGLFFLF